jgi:hypothetical protein
MWRRYLNTNVRFLGIVAVALGRRILRRVGAGRLGATTSRH